MILKLGMQHQCSLKIYLKRALGGGGGGWGGGGRVRMDENEELN